MSAHPPVCPAKAGQEVIVEEDCAPASSGENLWSSLSSFLPITCTPTQAQIIALRNIVIRLKGTEVGVARDALGDDMWCLLIFAGIPGCESRTLVRTTVGSVDISNWDVGPTAFEVPCIACGDETPCQETHSGGITACRECLLADKGCSFLSSEGRDRLLKRKRESHIEEMENPNNRNYMHPVAESITAKMAELEGLDFDQCRTAIAKMTLELKQTLNLGHELKEKLRALVEKDKDALVAINSLRRNQEAEMTSLIASLNGN